MALLATANNLEAQPTVIDGGNRELMSQKFDRLKTFSKNTSENTTAISRSIKKITEKTRNIMNITGEIDKSVEEDTQVAKMMGRKEEKEIPKWVPFLADKITEGIKETTGDIRKTMEDTTMKSKGMLGDRLQKLGRFIPGGMGMGLLGGITGAGLLKLAVPAFKGLIFAAALYGGWEAGRWVTDQLGIKSPDGAFTEPAKRQYETFMKDRPIRSWFTGGPVRRFADWVSPLGDPENDAELEEARETADLHDQLREARKRKEELKDAAWYVPLRKTRLKRTRQMIDELKDELKLPLERGGKIYNFKKDDEGKTIIKDVTDREQEARERVRGVVDYFTPEGATDTAEEKQHKVEKSETAPRRMDAHKADRKPDKGADKSNARQFADEFMKRLDNMTLKAEAPTRIVPREQNDLKWRNTPNLMAY